MNEEFDKLYDKAYDILMTWDTDTLISDILMDMKEQDLKEFVENNK